jgi:hypothetical protein
MVGQQCQPFFPTLSSALPVFHRLPSSQVPETDLWMNLEDPRLMRGHNHVVHFFDFGRDRPCLTRNAFSSESFVYAAGINMIDSRQRRTTWRGENTRPTRVAQ